MNTPIRLAILGSGNGTNAQQISEYFAGRSDVQVACIIYNKRDAYIAQRAKNLGIPLRMITKQEFNSPEFTEEMKGLDLDLIVLAGFLWKIPSSLIQAYPKKIVNIHPALLPKYGGKGFYGERVHEAVVAAKEQFSGITVHYVNEVYDSGEFILQAYTKLDANETPDSLAAKIHKLEQAYFPVAIEQVLFRR